MKTDPNKDGVSMDDYVDLAMRTDTEYTAELIRRLTDPKVVRLLHAAMGLATETGELVDMLKKHIFANKPLDLVNATEEIGDISWYHAMAVDVLRTTIREVMTINIAKLRKRYPEKFTGELSANRDVGSERELLEDHILLTKEDKAEIKDRAGLGQSKLSLRGHDWNKFAFRLLDHIENYSVPQYGDKGTDKATDYTLDDISKQIEKYQARIGKNVRKGQDSLDMLKIAHYAQMGYNLAMAQEEKDGVG